MWGLEFLPITGYPRLPFPELCIFKTQGQLRGYVYFEHLWVSEMHSLLPLLGTLGSRICRATSFMK